MKGDYLIGLGLGAFFCLFFLTLEQLTGIRFEVYILSCILTFILIIYLRGESNESVS